jgi:hypothetical protein
MRPRLARRLPPGKQEKLLCPVRSGIDARRISPPPDASAPQWRSFVPSFVASITSTCAGDGYHAIPRHPTPSHAWHAVSRHRSRKRHIEAIEVFWMRIMVPKPLSVGSRWFPSMKSFKVELSRVLDEVLDDTPDLAKSHPDHFPFIWKALQRHPHAATRLAHVERVVLAMSDTGTSRGARHSWFCQTGPSRTSLYATSV